MNHITSTTNDGVDADLMKSMIEAGLMDALPAEITIEATPEVQPEEVEDLVAAVSADDKRKEIYASMSGRTELVEPENIILEAGAAEVDVHMDPSVTPVAPVAPKVKKARAAAAPKTPKTPKAPRGTNEEYLTSMLTAEVELVNDDVATPVAEIIAAIPAIKVQDKLVNFFEHFHKARPLSVYTQIAVGVLKRDGKMTAKTLADSLMASAKKSGVGGYSEGTARSQAQQQMTLLTVLKIATKTGSEISPASNSVYWEKLAS